MRDDQWYGHGSAISGGFIVFFECRETVLLGVLSLERPIQAT